MILKTCFLLVLSVAWEVSGASFSKVFVQTGPEAAPAVEYLEYPYHVPSYANPHLGQLTAAPIGFEYPIGSSYSYGTYGTPCSPSGCFYPGQAVAAVAPVAPSANIIEYAPPAPNVPIVYSQVQKERPGYEYSYVVVDQHTGDHKAHNEMSDGGVVRGEYSFLQPNGQVREVTYIADDMQGFNAYVKNVLPVEKAVEIKHTETSHHGAPCHEVKSEALTAHESHIEHEETHEHHSDHENLESEDEHNESHSVHEKHGGHEDDEVEILHHEEVHEKHGGHEAEAEHHGGNNDHEVHHGDNNDHESHHDGNNDHEKHHDGNNDHEKHHDGNNDHEKHHESHATYEVHEKHSGHEHHEPMEHHGGNNDHGKHHESHESRHGGHAETESEEESTDEQEHEELTETIEEHEEEVHESHKEHSGHGHENHDAHHAVEVAISLPLDSHHETSESHPTHEKLIQIYHAVAHEPKHEETEHHVPQHADHEVHQEVQEHGAAEGNVYVSYKDVIKCIQAAMAKVNNNPSIPRPTSPLTYLVFNKPC